jgi:hypothetical protein
MSTILIYQFECAYILIVRFLQSYCVKKIQRSPFFSTIIDGHRAVPCRASSCLAVPPCRAGRAMAVLRARGSSQGTAHGPLFHAVPPGEHGKFHRAVPTHGPCGKKELIFHKFIKISYLDPNMIKSELLSTTISYQLTKKHNLRSDHTTQDIIGITY